ncbi:MAG: non-canonical purine NTP pyrophosphatase, partial [Chloroflexi bacterium]|nr:non-canonical purine NTP pyrophosphatase [Chloroflexota bacterium]
MSRERSATSAKARSAAPAPRRLVVATRSQHKLEELRALLQLPGLQLLSLDDIGVEDEAIEDASTFRGNAILKARFYGDLSDLPTLADDSGLEVDALGGLPGVRTKRYAGESATDSENNARLLAELGDLPPERRTARYRCVLAFLDPRDRDAAERPWVVVRSGSFEGRIATHPRGTGGFGYDPLFEPRTETPGGRTVAQM